MTKRRLIILSACTLLIVALAVLAAFVSHYYTVRLDARALEETEELNARQAEKRQAEIREKLISGKVNDENLKIVFLTFNNGPSQYTGEVLDILKNNEVQATFFTNGLVSPGQEALYQRIVNEGHVLGNYTFYGTEATQEDPYTLLDEAVQLSQLQQQITGKPYSTVFRFPGGSANYSQDDIDLLVNQGYTYFDWNVECDETTSTEEAFKKIMEAVHKQSVSVVALNAELAEGANDRKILDSFIKQLKTEGYTIMTLDPAYNLTRFVQPTGWSLPVISEP